MVKDATPISRTTLRSWRQIFKLAGKFNIDLSLAEHVTKPVSLTYVQKLINRLGLTPAKVTSPRLALLPAMTSTVRTGRHIVWV